MLNNLKPEPLPEGDVPIEFDALGETQNDGAPELPILEGNPNSVENIIRASTPLFETIAPLYLVLARRTLNDMQDDGKPTLVLYRDGQFIRNIMRLVRTAEYPDVPEENIIPAILTRKTFDAVDESIDPRIKPKFVEYLKDLHCFDPTLRMVDTGLSGTIMEDVCRYRNEYWEANILDPVFVKNLADEYGLEVEDIQAEPDIYREIYNGNEPLYEDTWTYAVETKMIGTIRNYYHQNKQKAVKERATPLDPGPDDISFPPFHYTPSPGKDGEGTYEKFGAGSITALLNIFDYQDRWNIPFDSISSVIKIIEGRLNGFMAKIGGIKVDANGNLKFSQDITEGTRELFGAVIDKDPVRRNINLALMQIVKNRVIGLLKTKTPIDLGVCAKNLFSEYKKLEEGNPKLVDALRESADKPQTLKNLAEGKFK